MEENDRKSQFLLVAYNTRIRFFSQHATRTWNRFNLLLTVELALSGFSLKLWFDGSAHSPHLWLLPAFGLLASIIWYLLAAQDLNAYLGYRDQINLVEELATRECGVEKGFPAFNPLGGKGFHVTHWWWGPISLTNLLSLIPLFFVAIWILALIWITT